MHKLWIKCVIYFIVSAYIIDDKPVICAMMDDYSDTFEDYSKSYEYDIYTDFASSVGTWKAAIYHLRPKRIHLWTESLPNRYGFYNNGLNFRRCAYSHCRISYGIHRECHDISKVHVIAFFPHELFNQSLPVRRSPHQKYVFVSTEPHDRYPKRSDIEELDSFFNWTWTYKLHSDLIWVPFVVENTKRKIVAPKMNVKWIKQEQMHNVSKSLLEILKRKTKAAAWFTTDCKDPNREYVNTLKKLLHERYNLSLDTYGKCSEFQCSPHNEENCRKLIRRDYYFYLAFESACSEDYVTDVLLHAVQYNAIPIVYGCANYDRFLPDGSYLNAKTQSIAALAARMHMLINNFSQYVAYFKWTNHYIYHRTTESAQTDIFCRMCALLHSNKMDHKTVYTDFEHWWYQDSGHRTSKKSKKKQRGKTKKTTKTITLGMNGESQRPKDLREEKTWFQKLKDSPVWGLLYSFY